MSDRISVADVMCLQCNTNMSFEIPSENVDEFGIENTLRGIEASACPVCGYRKGDSA